MVRETQSRAHSKFIYPSTIGTEATLSVSVHVGYSAILHSNYGGRPWGQILSLNTVSGNVVTAYYPSKDVIDFGELDFYSGFSGADGYKSSCLMSRRFMLPSCWQPGS
jgi:hypothetical protein